LITRNFLGNNGKRIVAFGEGILETDPTGKFLLSPPGNRNRLEASPGKMYFNDRKVSVADPRPVPPNTFPPGPLYQGPFSSLATDSFRLQIEVETGRTVYTDLTWNCTATLELRCANEVMYGFSTETTALPWACVISLERVPLPESLSAGTAERGGGIPEPAWVLGKE